jgi:hypothetical protein
LLIEVLFWIFLISMSSDSPFKNRQRIIITPGPANGPRAATSVPGTSQAALQVPNAAAGRGRKPDAPGKPGPAAGGDSKLVEQGRSLFGTLDSEHQSILSTLLRQMDIPDREKFLVIASLASELVQFTARGDLTLEKDTAYQVTFEGLPPRLQLEGLIEMIKKIDPGIDVEELMDARMLSALPTKGGTRSRSVQIVFRKFLISDRIHRFIQGNLSVDGVPRSLYIRSEPNRNLACEILLTSELKQRVKLLETLAWTKTQIEAHLRENVEQGMRLSGISNPAVTVRFNTVRRDHGTLYVCPCSESKIMLCFANSAMKAAMWDKMPELRLEAVGPCPAVDLVTEPWATTTFSLEVADIRAAGKEKKARNQMAQFQPVPAALFNVSCDVDLKLQEKQRGILSGTVGQIEERLRDALGGINSGILDVQLGMTSTGRPLLHKVQILVCDACIDDPRRSNALVGSLERGTAIRNEDTFSSIKARGTIKKALLKSDKNAPLTPERVAVAIAGHLEGDPQAQLAIPAKHSGVALPLSGGDHSHLEVPQSNLGPHVPSPYLDIRRIFSTSSEQPTIAMLVRAVRDLESAGEIHVYGDEVSGVDILVIHSALHDAWTAGATMDLGS